MLLAIDGSTVATGFAVGGPGSARPRGGVWRLPGADELVFDRTLAQVAESIMLTAQACKAVWCCIEAPMETIDRFHSAASAIALMQLTGAMRAGAARAGCKIDLVSVRQARRHFIGTGYLDGDTAKALVMKRCRELGWPYEDDNQADANAVWAYGMARHYPKHAPETAPLFASAAGGQNRG